MNNIAARGAVVCSIIGLSLLLNGCGQPVSPNRSPSTEEDPARASRAATESTNIDEAIRQAEQQNARRQGFAPRNP